MLTYDGFLNRVLHLLWWSGGGLFFFLGESLSYNPPTPTPRNIWRIRLSMFPPVHPTRCWPPCPWCIPSPSPLELPSRCGYHDAIGKISRWWDTFFGRFRNPQFLTSVAWHLWLSSELMSPCVNVNVYSSSVCLNIFCMPACGGWNPAVTACAHDQQKEPKKLTVSLLMSLGCSPVWGLLVVIATRP